MKIKQLSRQQAALLHALKLNVRVSNRDLNAVCFRYSARIAELRKMGYKIETIKSGKRGLVHYRRTCEVMKQGWLL